MDQLLQADLDRRAADRRALDAAVIDWSLKLSEGDLAVPRSYRSMRGAAGTRRFGSLVAHFFNHPTHHRGQVTTLLSQQGPDAGMTDLLALIPDLGASPAGGNRPQATGPAGPGNVVQGRLANPPRLVYTCSQ